MGESPSSRNADGVFEPFHIHDVPWGSLRLEEEHVLVLEGRLTLLPGERTHDMGPGHYVCFPAGQRVGHALVNRGELPCRYLVIGSRDPHDVAVHTDTGRVSVKLLEEGLRGTATQGYWDGVDVDAVP